ncbi:MAG TPA: toprim domain-containing protein [Terriglobales bacterium]|nr:toprim domain-containing protein [Terriglobales bacterium]
MSAGAINFPLAKQVPIARVLAYYGVQLHATGGELRGQCPLPEHTSRESHNSFSVNPARNLWCCQSQSCIQARDGQLGGSVLDLVARMERCSIREAAIKLTEWFGTGEVAPERVQPTSAPEMNRPLRFQLSGLDHSHSYLESRGITPLTARTLGIGYYGGPGIMHGRVAIPVHNVARELVAYAGRSVKGEDPKYRFPPGFHKSQELFLLHRARDSGSDTVIVVEGFFDAAKVWQSGHRNVVALMGSSLSESQAGLLQKHFREAVLMLDGDTAGQSATAAIMRRLSQIIKVEAIHLSPGVQPDQLASREINTALFGHLRPKRGLER